MGCPRWGNLCGRSVFQGRPGRRRGGRSCSGAGRARSVDVGLERASLPVALEPDLRAHVLQLYGGLAAEVLAPAAEDHSLLERLHPGGPDILAQVHYAATHEWARSADDVLRRRTTCFHRGLADDALRSRVEDILERELGRDSSLL